MTERYLLTLGFLTITLKKEKESTVIVNETYASTIPTQCSRTNYLQSDCP